MSYFMPMWGNNNKSDLLAGWKQNATRASMPQPISANYGIERFSTEHWKGRCHFIPPSYSDVPLCDVTCVTFAQPGFFLTLCLDVTYSLAAVTEVVTVSCTRSFNYSWLTSNVPLWWFGCWFLWERYNKRWVKYSGWFYVVMQTKQVSHVNTPQAPRARWEIWVILDSLPCFWTVFHCSGLGLVNQSQECGACGATPQENSLSVCYQHVTS